MKVLLASDHGGFDLKLEIANHLKLLGHDVIDLGVDDKKSVDYPDYAKKLCTELLAQKAEKGILVCGSGQGVAMQANRFKGIRASLCWDIPSATLSRQHNDANVLCLGGRLIPFGTALEIVATWLKTPFLGDRHLTRVKKLDT